MSAGTVEAGTFRHEAVFYRGESEFVDFVTGFLRDSVRAQEPALVVVSARKIDRLRAELGRDADDVCFADMAEVGRNPARIIPAWREFVDEHAGSGRRFRGIGEPIGPDRSDVELVECHRHEALLNVAFAGSGDWWLVCPYDTGALDSDVLETARRTHPFLNEGGRPFESIDYPGLDGSSTAFTDALPDPAVPLVELIFGARVSLVAVRQAVLDIARQADLSLERTEDLVLAVNELATNSLRHGGGTGTLRAWRESDAVVCEVQDHGRIGDPLVGRARPGHTKVGGRGLWLVHQLCDLVQLRSTGGLTVVRVRMGLAGAAQSRSA